MVQPKKLHRNALYNTQISYRLRIIQKKLEKKECLFIGKHETFFALILVFFVKHIIIW